MILWCENDQIRARNLTQIHGHHPNALNLSPRLGQCPNIYGIHMKSFHNHRLLHFKKICWGRAHAQRIEIRLKRIRHILAAYCWILELWLESDSSYREIRNACCCKRHVQTTL